MAPSTSSSDSLDDNFRTGMTRTNSGSFKKGHPKIGGFRKGSKHTEAVKQSLREKASMRKAQNSGNWKGGGLPWTKLQALSRDDYTCQICGLKDREVMEVDHIVPQAKAPELFNLLENLMTLCANCHRRKTNRDLGDIIRHKLLNHA